MTECVGNKLLFMSREMCPQQQLEKEKLSRVKLFRAERGPWALVGIFPPPLTPSSPNKTKMQRLPSPWIKNTLLRNSRCKTGTMVRGVKVHLTLSPEHRIISCVRGQNM